VDTVALRPCLPAQQALYGVNIPFVSERKPGHDLTQKRFGLRREAQRHAAFERTKMTLHSIAHRAPESGSQCPLPRSSEIISQPPFTFPRFAAQDGDACGETFMLPASQL
jgi:hypothetical protein